MEGWPFLIARNYHRDFANVVVPDFLKEAGALEHTRRASGDFPHETGEAIYLKGQHDTLGVVDVVFREVQGTERMLGRNSDALLRDRVGRPIRVFEGFVVRERVADEKLHITTEQFDAVHRAVEPQFRSFWDSGSLGWSESVGSMRIDLPPAKGEKLRLHIHESPMPTLPELRAKTGEQIVEERTQSIIERTPPPSKRINKIVMFAVVAGILLGAVYLASRRSTKSNASGEEPSRTRQTDTNGVGQIGR